MPQVLTREDNWLEKAKEAILSGKIVAFPTETVYGLAASPNIKGSIENLNQLKKREPQKPYTIHIANPHDIYEYIESPPWLVKLAIKKLLPGPITIITKPSEKDLKKAKERFKENLKHVFSPEGIGFRCPDEPIARELLGAVNTTIVAPSANPAGKPAPTEVKEILEYYQDADELSYIIDGGKTRYARPSTVVKFEEKDFNILREGVIDARSLQKALQLNLLFVCTGNTCRSPMAEALAKRYIADLLKVSPEELADYRIYIKSAGTAAFDGARPSENATIAMQKYGLDISKHRSKLLRQEDIEEADIIFVMSESHKDYIIKLAPYAKDKVKLLSENGVPDPIGCDIDEYLKIARIIEEGTKKHIEEIIS